MIPKIIHRADAVIVTSVYVKNQIIKKYKTDPKKITVVYAGRDEFFYKVSDNKTITYVKKKFNITKKYCFTTATNHERKNIFGLITAFKNIEKLSEMQLIITGLLPKNTVKELQMHIKKLDLSNKVKFLGFVTKEDLRILYSNAALFVFPSFEEGFGFPVIEAAQCGCLPISSNTGSLPEVIGNKDLTFDPWQEKSITRKINEVLAFSSTKYNQELEVVKKHTDKFTWLNTAKKLSSVIDTLY